MREEKLKSPARPIWARYALAAVSILLSWLTREAFNPMVGSQRLPFVFFYPAIALSAWYGGLGPGIAGTILSAAIADGWYLGASHSAGNSTPLNVVALAGYLISSGFIIGAIETMHRTQRQLWAEINERKTAESSLAQETDLLATTLRSIGDAVIATDAQGHISFINPEAERLTGWTGKDAMGQPLPAVFHV